MVVKFVVFFGLVAAACASDFSSFAYEVADPFTGDFKHQAESRLGSDVRGQYSLLEADGTRRTVDYAAGAQGFNALVRKDPALVAAAPLVAAPAIAAPAIAPISYSALPLAYNKFNFGLAPYAYAKFF